jgi:hypothetical protein
MTQPQTPPQEGGGEGAVALRNNSLYILGKPFIAGQGLSTRDLDCKPWPGPVCVSRVEVFETVAAVRCSTGRSRWGFLSLQTG